MNDPRDQDEFVPHSLEAEQSLLGVLMFDLGDQGAFLDVDTVLSPSDFYEPFHGRLYGKIADLIRSDRKADPVFLDDLFTIDPAYDSLGGMRYLADLVDRAPPHHFARQLADKIVELSMRRAAMKAAAKVLQDARNPDLSGSDLMIELEKGVLGARKAKEEVILKPWADVQRSIIENLKNPQTRPLLRLGLKKLDKLIGGAEDGDLIVMGARTSMGKSALASCIGLNVASSYMRGETNEILGVIEINGEMSVEQMGRRHLTDEAFRIHGERAPTYRAIRTRTVEPPQLRILEETAATLETLPLYMTKRSGLTTSRLRSICRRQKAEFERHGIKLALVIIDHAGLINPDNSRGNRYQDQTEVSAACKGLGEELGCVVLALAQLSRKVEDREDKRPLLADLRDSGSWEQDADVVLGVYRDSYYARRESEPKDKMKRDMLFLRQSDPSIEIIGLKVREGDVATAKVWCDIGRNAIRDSDPDALNPELF